MTDREPGTLSLPADVRYLRRLFAEDESAAHLAALLAETPWERHVFTIYGRTVPMPREIAMFGPHGYRYSGVVHPPRALTPRLAEIAGRVMAESGLTFNSVLVNHYRDGADSVGWHSDADYEHGGQPAIASVSFGATRRFQMKPRRGRGTVSIDLEDGSLLLMGGRSQLESVHCLPKTRMPVGPRINLTFRHMAAAETASTR